MKRILLIIICLFLSLRTIYGDGFNWKFIAESEDNTSRIYLDKSSVREIDKNRYLWTFVDYLILEKDDNPNIRSVKSFIIFNCKRDELKVVTYTAYTKNMLKGKVHDDLIIPDYDMDSFNWNYYGPETLFGAVKEEVCF